MIKKYKNAEITFTEGTATSMNVNVGMRITTQPYENMSLNAGVVIALKENADLEKAYEQAWDFTLSQIAEKANEIRDIYESERLD